MIATRKPTFHTKFKLSYRIFILGSYKRETNCNLVMSFIAHSNRLLAELDSRYLQFIETSTLQVTRLHKFPRYIVGIIQIVHLGYNVDSQSRPRINFLLTLTIFGCHTYFISNSPIFIYIFQGTHRHHPTGNYHHTLYICHIYIFRDLNQHWLKVGARFIILPKRSFTH